ncbi:Glu/Leu/Phe/Val family dehydrogenase [Paenibacillus pinistramenti]|uniref:Glu/Leu/Phe/Val family dehydrogenase n=1 Tax=Paenibacillus pinistramenti TaxID=1768003 RepID=UPI0023AEA010|nr:Glu/Leu/Phe/Val dehydrogenase dimerization domain-containing protein [Paenibacillus pinistramenti]
MQGMQVWGAMEAGGFEEILYASDPASGLKAVIVLHNTQAGPALGGCRMWNYVSEEEALTDAMKLARGMTYKSAISGLPCGGGKAVIWGDPAKDKSEALFRSFGRVLERMKGRYITGVDLGTTVQDMDFIAMETSHVTDMTGTLGGSGNYTAEMTAYGVYLGIEASLQEAAGSRSLAGKRVAVQGLGKVGYALCRYLRKAGAELLVSDVNPPLTERAVREFGASAVSPGAIYAQDCDVFAPCALGGILNDAVLAQLSCRVVAGAANNQLAGPETAGELQARGILYAPDYAINAGGIIATALELQGRGAEEIRRRVETIGQTLADVYRLARSSGADTAQAADRLAEARLAELAP